MRWVAIALLVPLAAAGKPAPKKKPAPAPVAPAPAPVAPAPPPVADTPVKEEPKPQRIALGGVQLQAGVPVEVGNLIEQTFEAELRKLDGWGVLTSAEVTAQLGLERQKALFTGSSELDVPSALEASDVVQISVAPGTSGWTIAARRAGGATRNATADVAKDPKAIGSAVPGLVRALFPDEKQKAPPALVPTATAPANKPVRVAVLEVRSVGDVPARAFAALNQSLTPELRKLEGVSAISAAELVDMLGMERKKQLLGCGEDAAACLEELGGALDADEMLSFDLTRVGDTWALTARRSDLRKGKVVSTLAKQFEQRDGEELLAIIGPLVAELYPERPLKGGRERGVDQSIIRRLNPPPLPRWAFVTTGVLAAGAAGSGAGFGFVSTDAQNEFRRLAARSVMEPIRGQELNALEARAKSNATIANGLFLAAGSLALVAIVEAFFTDWRDDGAAIGQF